MFSWILLRIYQFDIRKGCNWYCQHDSLVCVLGTISGSYCLRNNSHTMITIPGHITTHTENKQEWSLPIIKTWNARIRCKDFAIPNNSRLMTLSKILMAKGHLQNSICTVNIAPDYGLSWSGTRHLQSSPIPTQFPDQPVKSLLPRGNHRYVVFFSASMNSAALWNTKAPDCP